MPYDISGNYDLPSPAFPLIPNTLADANELNSIFTDVEGALGNVVLRSGAASLTGALKHIDGTAALPGITFSADTNTGFYRPGADSLGVTTGSVERMRIDATGNVGIGGTPTERLAAVGAAFTNARILISTGAGTTGNAAELSLRENNQATTLGRLTSYGSTFGSGLSDAMELYNSRNGFLAFGTNNTERVRIDASGNVLIGSTTQLDPIANYQTIQLAGGTGAKIDIGSTSLLQGRISGDSNGFNIQAMQSAKPIVFRTGAAERMRIDSSGNVGIGSAPYASLAGADRNFLSVNGSASSVIAIGAGGSVVGTLYADAGSFAVEAAGAVPMIFRGNSAERLRIDASGHIYPGVDAAQYFGTNTRHWADVYVHTLVRATAGDLTLNAFNAGGQLSFRTAGGERMRITAAGVLNVGSGVGSQAGDVGIARAATPTTGAVYFGNTVTKYLYYDGTKFEFAGGPVQASNFTATSDARLKRDVEQITGALDKVQAVRGVTFERIDEPGRRQTGVLAQELQAVLPEAVSTFVKDGASGGTDEYLTVNHGAVIGLLIEAIKELRAEVAELRAAR